MEENYRFCKKCLTRDIIDKDDFFKTLKMLIDGIDKNEKTPSEEYERRLNVCLSCERLADGMCNACGCYVELRAAKKDTHCPYKNW